MTCSAPSSVMDTKQSSRGSSDSRTPTIGLAMTACRNDYLEIKRHKNKPEQQFHCELLHRETGYAVLRYVARKPGLIADIIIPPGSTTIAHYWQKRPYVVWRMFDSSTLPDRHTVSHLHQCMHS